MRLVLLLALLLGAAAGIAMAVAVPDGCGMPRRYYDYPDDGETPLNDERVRAVRVDALPFGTWACSHPAAYPAVLGAIVGVPVAAGVLAVGGLSVLVVRGARSRRRRTSGTPARGRASR